MNLKLLNQLICLSGSAILLSGCAKGFDVAKNLDSPQAAAVTGTNPQLANKISGDNGELSWATQSLPSDSPESQSVEYSYEMKIPFGYVYEAASFVTKALVPYSCQWVQGIAKEMPAAYTNGEIPCGQFVSQQWKQLLSIPIEPFQTVEDGFTVTVSGANIPVLLSRYARQGYYTQANLDTLREDTLVSSAQFGQDIALRYSPNGTNARLELCANVPGTEITSSVQTVHASASKKILGVKVGHASNFTINPGLATYEYGRGCLALDYGWKGSSLVPEINFQTTVAPHVKNASYQGLDVRINDWFLRLVDKIMSFFKVSFREQLISQVVREANNIIDRDIETGEWFTKVHGPEMVKQVNYKINSQISRVMSRVGIPSSREELKGFLKDNCRIQKLAGGASWTERLDLVCRQIIDQVELKVEPFYRDPESDKAGCYSHFANIHDAKTKWWAKTCKFSAKFTITLAPDLKPYAEEIHTLLTKHIGVKKIPDEWKQAISQYQLDPYTFNLVLEELEKRGYTRLIPSDLLQQIPALVSQVRGQIAAQL